MGEYRIATRPSDMVLPICARLREAPAPRQSRTSRTIPAATVLQGEADKAQRDDALLHGQVVPWRRRRLQPFYRYRRHRQSTIGQDQVLTPRAREPAGKAVARTRSGRM